MENGDYYKFYLYSLNKYKIDCLSYKFILNDFAQHVPIRSI